MGFGNVQLELRAGGAMELIDAGPGETVSQLLDRLAQQTGLPASQLKLSCKTPQAQAAGEPVETPSIKLDSAESTMALKSLLRRTGKLDEMGLGEAQLQGDAPGPSPTSKRMQAESEARCQQLERSVAELQSQVRTHASEVERLRLAQSNLCKERDALQAELTQSEAGKSKLKAELAQAKQTAEAQQAAVVTKAAISEGGRLVNDQSGVPAGCRDYDVDDEGTPQAVTRPGTFRLSGHGFLDYGFQLTGNPEMPGLPQQGHFMCRVQFEVCRASSEIFLKFDYHMHGSQGGEGLCAYLLDPSIPGWYPCRCTQLVTWASGTQISILLGRLGSQARLAAPYGTTVLRCLISTSYPNSCETCTSSKYMTYD